jgi:hypothetical protein
MGERVLEIVRIIIIAMLGALVVWAQGQLFLEGIIGIEVDTQEWFEDYYFIGATIVYLTALFSAILWYFIASIVKIDDVNDSRSMAFVWWLLLLFPIIAICAALAFFNNSNDALLWLSLFYVFDVLLVFWFATAISSPGLLKFVVPLSMFLRRLLRL